MVGKKHKRVDDTTIPDDPEVAMVNQATKQGTINVVGGILNDPQVQQLIKSALLKETIKNSIVLACLMIGLLKLYDVAKMVIGFNWVGDLVSSIVLILIALIYLLKEMYSARKRKWSRNAK